MFLVFYLFDTSVERESSSRSLLLCPVIVAIVRKGQYVPFSIVSQLDAPVQIEKGYTPPMPQRTVENRMRIIREFNPVMINSCAINMHFRHPATIPATAYPFSPYFFQQEILLAFQRVGRTPVSFAHDRFLPTLFLPPDGYSPYPEKSLIYHSPY
jgi:hypothetical protein